jgi:hypothetical protein
MQVVSLKPTMASWKENPRALIIRQMDSFLRERIRFGFVCVVDQKRLKESHTHIIRLTGKQETIRKIVQLSLAIQAKPLVFVLGFFVCFKMNYMRLFVNPNILSKSICYRNGVQILLY